MKTRLSIGATVLGIIFTSLTPAVAQAPIHHQLKRVVPVSAKSFALRLTRSHGWPLREFACLDRLWMRESSWNPKAKNPTSTAFGIWQGITETSRNPFTQIVHGVRYVERRYGSACHALAHSDRMGWY